MLILRFIFLLYVFPCFLYISVKYDQSLNLPGKGCKTLQKKLTLLKTKLKEHGAG